MRGDEIPDLLDGVLGARALQGHEQDRPHQLRGRPDEVDIARQHVHPREILALDEHVVRDDDGPGLAVQKDLHFLDQFVCDFLH